MRTKVKENPEPHPPWAGLPGPAEQHIDVTVATPLTPDQSQRLKDALASVEGVVQVETPAASVSPLVPREMRDFADRLWEIL